MQFSRALKACSRPARDARSNRENSKQFANLYFGRFFFLFFRKLLFLSFPPLFARLSGRSTRRVCCSQKMHIESEGETEETDIHTDRQTDRRRKETILNPCCEWEIRERTKRTRSMERSLHKTFFFLQNFFFEFLEGAIEDYLEYLHNCCSTLLMFSSLLCFYSK